MGLFSVTQTREGESLKDPDALAFFYMDTMMCSQFYFKNEECMEKYNSKWLPVGKRKLYKECLSHLDKYKACIVGINQEKLSHSRKRLSDHEFCKKKLDAIKSTNPAEERPLSKPDSANEDELIKF